MRFSAKGTLSGAMATSAASKGLRAFNKMWTPGDSLRVLYPLVWVDEEQTWDVIVGAVWGHPINDAKKLKFKNFARFIPSLCEVKDDGTTVGEPDLAFKFSQIAPVFVTAQKAREIASVNARKALTPEMKQEAIKEIESRYDPSSMSGVKPVLGRRDFITTAICVAVKIANGKADPATTATVYQPLKGPKANALIEILGDEKFLPIHQEGQDFAYLEVQYNFPANAERSQSSKDCKILGIAQPERLEIIDPESWKSIESRCKNLPKKPEDIVRRTTREVSEVELKQAISSYSILQLDDLDALNSVTNSTDIETLCKHVDVLKDLNLIQSLSNQELIDALNKADEEAEAKEAKETPVTTEVPNPIPDAPTLDKLIASPESNPQVTAPQESIPVVEDNLDINSLKAAAASPVSEADPELLDMDLGI